jgi:hypothetical protein
MRIMHRRKEQVPLESSSTSTIMRRAEFARGLAEVRAGRAPDYDAHDDLLWAYERGRQFGRVAPLNMPLRFRGRLNPKAVALFDAASDRGFIR